MLTRHIQAVAGSAMLAVTLMASPVSATGDWVTDGPDGAHRVEGYSLTRVFADDGPFYYAFAPGPDGRSFYTARRDDHDDGTTEYAIVRFHAAADGTLDGQPEVIVTDDQLRIPGVWDEGIDTTSATISLAPGNGGAGPISVTPSGELFLAFTAQAVDGGGSTIVRLASDGSLTRVVTSGDLLAADIYGAAMESTYALATASAPDRLWVRAAGWSPESGDLVRLVEVVDPNADGDWSDRDIHPLVLPDSLPAMPDGDWSRQYGAFTQDPDDGEHDPSRSILLPIVGRDGHYQVIRLTDLGDDGVLDEPGETTVVYDERTASGSLDPSFPPLLAARQAPADGAAEAGLELVLGQLTGSSRISSVRDGEVHDLVRGLFTIDGIAAMADGSVYVGVQAEPVEGRTQSTVLRLAPAAGTDTVASPDGATDAPAAGASPAMAWVPRAPVTDGVARIATWLWGESAEGSWQEAYLLYGADGSGPADILPGAVPWSGLCPAADGTAAAVFAEVEIPHEPHWYLVDVDGVAPPAGFTERTSGSMACPTPPQAIARVAEPAGFPPAPVAMSRIDLVTGEERVLIEDATPGLLIGGSPDGRLVATASGDDGTALAVVDIVDGTARVVADDLPGAVLRGAWSPDGLRLAFVTGPYDPMEPSSAGHQTVWLADVAAGSAPVAILEQDGYAPDLSWSPDGRSIAIAGRTDEGDCCCDGSGPLVVADVVSGATRTVAPDASFGAWSPVDPGAFAWGDSTRLVLETGGVSRDIVAPVVETAEGSRPAGWNGFMGWSPDGRFLGFGYPRLMTVDTVTGETRILVTEGDTMGMADARWWR